MKFAIIQNGGKQYKVEVGTVLQLEKMDAAEGETVKFPFVVLTDTEGSVELGAPYLSGTAVEGKVLEQGRDKKIRVVHKKSKKRMMRVRGHRQPFTKVEITAV
jgi:large subunit ribosomal protein L21